jgi:hypothetical protein
MYGYVTVNKPELKFKEFDRYRSYYCGLCSVLKEKYGINGQLSISYDMTFLILLLTGLYEPKTREWDERCAVHPFVKHKARSNYVTDYVADMNVLMTYYKCIDDWQDEKKFTRKAFSAMLSKAAKKVRLKYPDKAQRINEALKQLSDAEKRKEENIDTASSFFAEIMACMAVMHEDEWAQELYNLGYALGKFIYLCDAYEDLEADVSAGRYNVFENHVNQKDFDEMCEGILNVVMADCARAFERLPILEDAELMRNILYSGVWTRFHAAKQKRQKDGGKSERSV